MHLDRFELLLVEAVENALKRSCDLLVIDEIGSVEMLSNIFEKELNKLLRSEKPLIAAVHCDFIKAYETKGYSQGLDQYPPKEYLVSKKYL